MISERSSVGIGNIAENGSASAGRTSARSSYTARVPEILRLDGCSPA